MADSQQLAGSQFLVSAAAPATLDETGFAALTYTAATACEIQSFSGFAKQWETSSDNTYCTDPVSQKKVRPVLGEVSLTLQYDKTNTAFYNIIRTAELSQTDVISCQFLHENGTDSRYFTAQVAASNQKGGSSNDRITYEIMFYQQSDVVEVDA